MSVKQNYDEPPRPITIISSVIILSLIFAILKITGIIKWSWMWVLCPIWLFIITVVTIMLALTISGYVVYKRRK